ncbi:hypothetical protein BKI52_36005 [marine bacterium AO1-C]|nr:hypothetical protein BKI52_36005 [marine bacterium AO1-C]
MKTYLVVNATPNPEGQEDLKIYSEAVGALLAKAGGQNPTRAKLEGVVKGKPDYPLMLMMEFPNGETIKNLFESEAYQKLLPHRNNAFSNLNIYIFSDL